MLHEVVTQGLPDRQIKALLIEDDEGHQTLIKRHLRSPQLSIEWHCLSSGPEAKEYLLRTNTSDWPDFVLLDLNLKGFRGADLLKTIKHPDHPPVICCVFSTSDQQEEMALCYQMGANVCIAKSIEPEQFRASLLTLAQLLLFAQFPHRSNQ